MMTEPALEELNDQGHGLSVIPGGKGPRDNVAVALLVVAALAYLVVIRRSFRVVLAA